MDFFIELRGKECQVIGDAESADPDVGLQSGITDFSVVDLENKEDITQTLTEEEQLKIQTKAAEIIEEPDDDYGVWNER